jgi:hypothetical protein
MQHYSPKWNRASALQADETVLGALRNIETPTATVELKIPKRAIGIDYNTPLAAGGLCYFVCSRRSDVRFAGKGFVAYGRRPSPDWQAMTGARLVR